MSAPASGAPDRGLRRVVAQGLPRSFALGAAFSLAWSPCIGPILGVVLTLAAASGQALQGAVLLTSYSLGLGLWFMAFGAFFGWLSPRMRRLNPYLPRLMVASGVFFIVIGALMFLGEFTRLNAYFQGMGFAFSTTADAEERLSGSVGGWFGPAVAFFGGVVSFLSPCVLPLVPAYLVNIAGEAVLGRGDVQRSRAHVMGHAAAFVVGFTAVFAIAGASAGFLGDLASGQGELLTRIGGIVLMVLGMQMSGLIHIPYLDRTYQVGT
ncbi:MAG: cytochrome c biogenesis protein CcdA [Dehalococcoidia bacterium]